MNIYLSIIGVVLIVIILESLFASIKKVRQVGFKYARKSIVLFIKSPIKTIKLMKKKSLDRKEFRVNRNIWNKGKELDKIDDLNRYKKDSRVMNSSEVKLSLNVYEKDILKSELKESKKDSKDKKFDRITK